MEAFHILAVLQLAVVHASLEPILLQLEVQHGIVFINLVIFLLIKLCIFQRSMCSRYLLFNRCSILLLLLSKLPRRILEQCRKREFASFLFWFNK